jgi:hypothetical protein
MPSSPTPSSLVDDLKQRFGPIDIDDLQQALIPVYLPIRSIDKSEIIRRGSFYTVDITLEGGNEISHLTRGSTGKIIPGDFVEGSGTWEEIGKCRIHEVHDDYARGEFLAKSGQKGDLDDALGKVEESDYLEIDRYGIAAKLKSALAEQAFANIVRDAGYNVTRMPEDLAKHLMDDEGHPNFDFIVERNGIRRRVEVKSLWGTDTSKARLIHSKTKDYETSSCKFKTQDIFAVNLWLRTGNIYDFGFAVSEYEGNHSHGLPCATKSGDKLKGYVHQNPDLEIGDGRWFQDFDKVVDLTDPEKHDITSEVGEGWGKPTFKTTDSTKLDQFD